jgi:hypothetical protein
VQARQVAALERVIVILMLLLLIHGMCLQQFSSNRSSLSFLPQKYTHTHTHSLSLSLSLFLPVGLVSSLVAIAVRELFFVTSGNWDM